MVFIKKEKIRAIDFKQNSKLVVTETETWECNIFKSMMMVCSILTLIKPSLMNAFSTFKTFF